MNKTELIAEVAKKCAMSKKDAEKAVSATFDTIAEVLCASDKVQLKSESPRHVYREAIMTDGILVDGPQPQDQGAHRNSRYHRSRLQARQGAQGPDQQVIRTIGKASGFPDFCFDRSTPSCVWTNI